MLSQAITFTIALFALDLNDFVGNSLIGIHAKGNFVHQFELAMQLLQSQMIISWFVLNWAPSVNHFTSRSKKGGIQISYVSLLGIY